MALAAASPPEATATQEFEPLVTILPQEVIDSLAELDLELSEGKKKFKNVCKTSSSSRC